MRAMLADRAYLAIEERLACHNCLGRSLHSAIGDPLGVVIAHSVDRIVRCFYHSSSAPR